MSLVLYCPYLAAQSFLRKMFQDNRPAVDIMVGLLLWTLIGMNVAWCLRWVEAADTQRAAAAVPVEEYECEDCDITDEENSELLEENEELKSELKELRQENNVLKAGAIIIKKVPLKVIGMKIVGGFRHEDERRPVDAFTFKKLSSLEDKVLQALADGWVTSGTPIKGDDLGASYGVWFQNLIRYEVAPEPAIAPAPAPAPEPSSTADISYMLDAGEVAKKIHSLSKEWRTARQIQKALDSAPFAPLKTINSALYTMLNKGEVEKDSLSTGTPVWKLV